VSQDTETPTAEAEPAPVEPGAAAEGPDRPELYVAAAFAGAFLFARILKRIVE
jgi:3-oxoacyl-ACP reductase-like protein